MTDDTARTRKLEEMMLLYGLALSASTSLDLHETCHGFIRMLMANKNLARAAVWLRAAESPHTGPVSRVYAQPACDAVPLMLPAGHPLLSKLEVHRFFALGSDDPQAQVLVPDPPKGEGYFVFYRLSRVGFMMMYTAGKFRPPRDVELRKLRNVVDKFALALEGCLAHQRVVISENKYRSLFESSRDGVFFSTPEGRFIDVNPAGVRMLGYDRRHEVLALSIPDDVFLNRQDWRTYQRILEERGHVQDHELELKRRDGQPLIVLETSTVVRDEADVVVGYRGILRDVTEQRGLEMQLQRAQKMESLGLLAGGIAHDFNNILCGILGYSSLLERRLEGDDRAERYLRTIEEGARRAQELTSQLLGFARGGKYDPKPIDVGRVVQEAVRLLERVIDKAIVIDTRLMPGLPSVEGDPGQLHQVMMNLCLNARDAMPGGGRLTLETGVVGSATLATAQGPLWREGPFVYVSVRDTGAGMDKATVHRVFEPFFTTKEKGKGTGLGLALVYGVIKNHGGFVDVQSTPGQGSDFRVYLPVSGAPAEGAGQETLKVEPSKGECVLVADDDPVVRTLARDILEPQGYHVLSAEDGLEAVEVCQRHRGEIDVVLLDMVMPRMDGLQAFRAMRRIDESLKVVLSTGYAQDERAGEVLRGGARGFLRKPWSPNELLAAIRAAISAS